MTQTLAIVLLVVLCLGFAGFASIAAQAKLAVESADAVCEQRGMTVSDMVIEHSSDFPIRTTCVNGFGITTDFAHRYYMGDE